MSDKQGRDGADEAKQAVMKALKSALRSITDGKSFRVIIRYDGSSNLNIEETSFQQVNIKARAAD